MQHGTITINRVPPKSTYRDSNRWSFFSKKLHFLPLDEESLKKLLNGKKHPKEVEKLKTNNAHIYSELKINEPKRSAKFLYFCTFLGL